MEVISKFLALFEDCNRTVNGFNPKEDLISLKISYTLDKFLIPTIDEFIKISNELCSILENNTFEISFKVMDISKKQSGLSPDLVLTLKSANSGDTKYLGEIYERIKDQNFDELLVSESIVLDIQIKKPLVLECINRIYYLDKFFEYLYSLDLDSFLNIPIINNTKNNTVFLIDKSIVPFYTKTLFFVHSIDDFKTIAMQKIDLDEISRHYKLNCHFINSNLNITPYAFRFYTKPTDTKIYNFFTKLEVLLSLVYISNYSELIEPNVIKYHINGYRLITENIVFKDIDNFSTTIPQIFDWVYDGDKISEKIEIARNIISLDYRNSLLAIDETTLASVKSNFNIYLKENVGKYIELKNQITNNILDISIKSREIIVEFSTNFKNAFFANLSFVFSILILNLVEDVDSLINIFNKDLTILYLIVIGISFFFFILSRITSSNDIKHFSETLSNIKASYSSILSSEDLDNLFSSTIIESDKKYIKSRIKVYSFAWMTIIFVSLIALSYLSPYFRSILLNLIAENIQFNVL